VPKIPMIKARIPTLTSRVPRQEKQADSFYTSPEWRALIAAIKEQRGNQCADVGPHSGRILGDHIVEIKDGGALLDPANIMLRCAGCHNRKTGRERAKRAAAKW
jgi:5-methylcytosine-specific restriction enzyme A